jgi:hypothetical protein
VSRAYNFHANLELLRHEKSNNIWGLLRWEAYQEIISCFPFHFVHDTADVRQASPPFRIPWGTIASSQPLLRHNPFHNSRSPVIVDVVFDVITSIFKAKTYEILHNILGSYRISQTRFLRLITSQIIFDKAEVLLLPEILKVHYGIVKKFSPSNLLIRKHNYNPAAGLGMLFLIGMVSLYSVCGTYKMWLYNNSVSRFSKESR